MDEIFLFGARNPDQKSQSPDIFNLIKSRLKTKDLKDSRVARLISSFPDQVDLKKIIFSSARLERRAIFLMVLLKEVLIGVTVYLVWSAFEDLLCNFSDKFYTGVLIRTPDEAEAISMIAVFFGQISQVKNNLFLFLVRLGVKTVLSALGIVAYHLVKLRITDLFFAAKLQMTNTYHYLVVNNLMCLS